MTDLMGSPFTGPIEVDDAGHYRVRYDWSSGVELTTAIVELLAEVREVDPDEIDRLAEAIDPDALNRLFVPMAGGDRSRGSVSFHVGPHRVTVEGNGDIEVRQPTSG